MQVHFILVFVAFLWGLNPPVMKVGLLYVEPMAYNAIRMVVALGGGWFVMRRLAVWLPLARRDWRDMAICSLGFFFFQIFFTAGVQRTTAGNASLILGCLPVSIALINHLHRLEAIRPSVLAGIVISIIGVVTMVAGTGKSVSMGGEHVLGAAMLLLAQFSYGYYTVFSRRLLAVYSAYQVTAYILLLSTALFVVVAVPSLSATVWQAIPLAGWGSIVYSGLFPLCIGNCLWIWGAGRLGSTKASLYNNLPPVFAVAVGYLFLGEAFGWLQGLGAAVIFTGLYVAKHK